MERLFLVTKTEDRFTCKSKRDGYVMEFLKDISTGFYVYIHDFRVTQKSAVELPRVFDTIDKSIAEGVRKKDKQPITFMAHVDSHPPVSSNSPPLITTPEMEIDKPLITTRIEIVEDNTDETMPYYPKLVLDKRGDDEVLCYCLW